MSPEQINLTQSTFKDVLPIKEVAAELFYNRRFELDPSLKSLFSGDMIQQGQGLEFTTKTIGNQTPIRAK